MPALNTYNRQLYDWNPQIAARLLEKAKDPATTHDIAGMMGNPNPRPPKNVGYDHSLKGTGTLAYYFDPQEIKRYDLRAGMELERKLGPHPVMRLSPDVVRIYEQDPEEADAIIYHEQGHGAQQGKMELKQIYAKSSLGTVPLGLMLIEGGNEWALEKRGKTPPTRYMDKRSKRKQPYSVFRDFVYALEEKQHGIMRQVYRAAHKAGPKAAIRLLEAVPGIENLIETYAAELYQSQLIRSRNGYAGNPKLN